MRTNNINISVGKLLTALLSGSIKNTLQIAFSNSIDSV
jgi:hypothetical protein